MNKIITDSKKVDEVLNRGTIVEVFPNKNDFRKKLLSGQKLRFYIGFDATAPTLHLSHAKNFMLMEKFRKLGHEVIILFGDFTARIGDPSGKSSARKQLTREEVLSNVKEWKKMIKPLMSFDDKNNPVKIMYNHDWLSKLNFEDLIKLASNFTVQQMIERDMFEKRLKEGKPIFLHEFFYPLMQGYDSVAMEVDVEMCGTDQIFNALVGRTLLRKLKDKDKFVVAVTLMENPKTGELMSKSKGTGVFLGTDANDMYGQIMAQPDEMIEILLTNCTYLSSDEIKEIIKSDNPRDAKARLAKEVVEIHYSRKDAEKAEKEFEKIFKQKDKPTDIPVFKTKKKKYQILDLLIEAKMTKSKGEARRLTEQGAVRISDKKVTDWQTEIQVKNGLIIQVGKRKFVKVSL